MTEPLDNNLQQYIAAAAGFLGLVLASALVRLGWTGKGVPETERPNTSFVGSIVGGNDVKELIEGLDSHRRSVDALEDSIRDLTREARTLGDEVRRNTNTKGN